MNLTGILISSFFGAVLSAMGMGGGGILLIYLTAYAGMAQQEAQGINLVFFVPIAIVAIFIHARNKLIRWRVALPCAGLGLAGVWLGSRLALSLEPDALGKLFGVFLLFVGARELFAAKEDDKAENK